MSWILLTALVSTGGSPSEVDVEAFAAVQRFLKSYAAIDSLTYRFKKTERLRNGEVHTTEQLIKIREPGRAYMATIQPHPGREVIYDATREADELIVHPGSFPDFTLSLDIRGGLATENEHHIVSHLGFGYTVDTIIKGIALAQRIPWGERVVDSGEATVNGRRTRVVSLHTEKRPFEKVRARDGETLWQFGNRVGMDPYLIYYVNPSIDDITDELDAREYDVPRMYGAKTVFWFDVATGLPVRQKTWDWRGRLYERYDFIDMKVNPGLTDRDFDPDNPEYDF